MNIEEENTALIPLPKIEDYFYDWYARHEAKKALAAENRYDLIFIGDSITHILEGDENLDFGGERYWQSLYAPRQALNLGFSWDRTQNVLWRLQHGEFENQAARKERPIRL